MCMCKCVCMCIYMCMCMCMCIYMCMCMCMCLYMCVCVCVCMRARVCLQLRVFVHVDKRSEFVSVRMRATSGSIVCLKVEVVWKKMKMSGLSIDK